jgi:hypothetical protein
VSILADLSHSGGRLPAISALAGLTAGAWLLAGCAGPVADSEFPNINDAPPRSQVRMLTPEQQAATVAELRAKARAARHYSDE